MRKLYPHRVSTWLLLLWNVGMAAWIIGGIASASSSSRDCGSLSQSACDSASNVGTGIGVALLLVLWFIVVVPLLLVAILTRKNRD